MELKKYIPCINTYHKKKKKQPSPVMSNEFDVVVGVTCVYAVDAYCVPICRVTCFTPAIREEIKYWLNKIIRKFKNKPKEIVHGEACITGYLI